MADSSEVRRLEADLADAANDIEDQASMVVRKTAADVVATSKEHANVDTGLMRSTIDFEMDGPLAAEAGPTTHYAPYVHDGTSRIAPNPFMNIGLDRHEPAFRDAIQKIADPLR